MKYTLVILVITAALLGCSGIAGAMSYTFTPYALDSSDGYEDGDPDDLFDLDHYKAVSWGINKTGIDLEREFITSAVLRFDDIRNWDGNTNDLYVRLVENTPTTPLNSGVASFYDGQVSGDYFANWEGIDLVHYHDLGTIGQDLEYVFRADELAHLGNYLSDDFFGLTFDADCHFWNNGVSLEIETARISPIVPDTVPEPATLVLVGGGVLGLIAIRRKRAAQ